jgi:hypothetical protein
MDQSLVGPRALVEDTNNFEDDIEVFQAKKAADQGHPGRFLLQQHPGDNKNSAENAVYDISVIASTA